MKKGVKLLGVFLMCVLLFALTACGTKDTSTGNTSETQQENTQETEKEEVVEYPANVNLLTGVADLTDEAIGKRPVAVMVNNVTAAFPQYGIAQADIIFEIPVEGGATCFMAMYGDYMEGIWTVRIPAML